MPSPGSIRAEEQVARWCTVHRVRRQPHGRVEVEATSCDLVRHSSPGSCVSSTLAVAFDQAELGLNFGKVRADPSSHWLDQLTGTPLRGLRRRLGEAEASLDLDPLIFQLVDDLPVVVMIAEYGRLRAEGDRTISVGQRTSGHRRLDVCAGWAADGDFASAVRVGRPMPLTNGRAIDDGDLTGWCAHSGSHSDRTSAPGDQLRRRLLIAQPDQHRHIDASARLLDTYVEPDGVETVLHEYKVDMKISDSGIIRDVVAHPGNLPGIACAHASSSVTELLGENVASLRGLVPRRLTGPRTCTHLNDVVRSFGSLNRLK